MREKPIRAGTWEIAERTAERYLKGFGLIAVVDWYGHEGERHRLYRQFNDDGGVNFEVGARLVEVDRGNNFRYSWPGKLDLERFPISEKVKTMTAAERVVMSHLRKKGLHPFGNWFTKAGGPWWVEKGVRCRLFCARDGEHIVFSTVAELRYEK